MKEEKCQFKIVSNIDAKDGKDKIVVEAIGTKFSFSNYFVIEFFNEVKYKFIVRGKSVNAFIGSSSYTFIKGKQTCGEIAYLDNKMEAIIATSELEIENSYIHIVYSMKLMGYDASYDIKIYTMAQE